VHGAAPWARPSSWWRTRPGCFAWPGGSGPTSCSPSPASSPSTRAGFWASRPSRSTITFPFARAVVTPSCFGRTLGRKHVRYDGYHELAYLHPRHFSPDPRIPDQLGLDPGEPYFVTRFVSWEAAHDRGHSGFTLDGQRDLVRRLADHGRVVLTSESPVPPDLERYRLRVAPSRIHDVLAHAALYVGEGATMASEAALLGVPSLYINPLQLGYLEEQERRYGLVRCIAEPARAIDEAVRLAVDRSAGPAHRAARERLLSEKIDVTAWLVEYVSGLRGHRP
jgi:predicted glycosyltransferase